MFRKSRRRGARARSLPDKRPRRWCLVRAKRRANHRHRVAGDVRDLLVRLAGTLRDHDRFGERALRSCRRGTGNRAMA